MGQEFCKLCAPEDPAIQNSSQVTVPTGSERYPSTNRDLGVTANAASSPAANGTGSAPEDTRGGQYEDAGDPGFFAPPPDGDDNFPIAAPDMPPPAARGPEASPTDPTGAGSGLTLDFILSDIDQCEEAMYGEIFLGFNGGQAVPTDNEPFRAYVTPRICVDLDLIYFSQDPVPSEFSSAFFMTLLRDHAVSEEEVLNHFLGISAEMTPVASEECRNGLLTFANQRLSANFNNERWERIFDACMWDAGLEIGLEEWTKYCKRVARIVRLIHDAKV